MKVRIKQQGEAFSVPLSRQAVKAAGFRDGSSVEIFADKGTIIIARKQPIRYRIDDLVEQMKQGDQPKEFDWGPPQGREVW